jgi:DNA-binding transcriptional MerR regulator
MSAGTSVPDKLYFKIGEVAKILGVKPYVLRYWESEFSAIRPTKARSHHRVYRRKDIETLLGIKELLYNQRYTIEGAKRRLRELQRGGVPAPADHVALGGPEARYRALLLGVKKELLEIYRMLEERRPGPAAGEPEPAGPAAPSRSSPVAK